MGDPIECSPEQRAAARQLARAIVESVRADERMPLDTECVEHYLHPSNKPVFLRWQVEDLVFKLAAEVERLEEERDKAAERLTFCLRIYKGYRIESRGPAGCIFDAIAALRPDVAMDLGELDPHDAYDKHWPEEQS